MTDCQPASPVVPPVVRLCEVAKRFGRTYAVRGVSLDLRAGTVHGLVGANGAGKSTLVKILAGVVTPDSGTIEVDGVQTTLGHGRAATLGLAFIHQELALVPAFTVLENLALGRSFRRRGGFVDYSGRRIAGKRVAERLSFPFSIDAPLRGLGVAERRLVMIGRAIMGDARVLVMDEPTASLGVDERDRLLEIVRQLAAQGMAVLFVSHQLDEIESIATAVTVLRDGLKVARFEAGNFSRHDLVPAIVGEEETVAGTAPDSDRRTAGDVVLEVSNLARPPAVQEVTFTVHAGEVLGVAGLVGAGRTELARMLFGVDKPTAGSMWLMGDQYSPHSSGQAVRAGVSLVPEDRRMQGLVLRGSVAANVAMPSWERFRRWRRLPIIDGRGAHRHADDVGRRLRLQASSTRARVATLSGGNQQKVVIGRWLDRQARLLILDEPTQGVDVRSRAELHRLISTLAKDGMAILFISSDFEELSICQRVIVMKDGRIAGELTGTDIDGPRLVRLCYGH